MKILFLDVDGVLIRLHSGIKKDFRSFDPDLAERLGKLLETTGAKIVVSSSWRHHMDSFQKAWIKANLDWNLVISKTGYGTDGGRSTEILQWLDNYHRGCKAGYHVTHWCAVDDEQFDMKAVKRLGKLVKTEASQGLTEEKAKDIEAILTK